MITIKRKSKYVCFDDPVHHKLTLSNLNIYIDEGSYDMFRYLMDEIKIDAVEALRFVIYEGLDLQLPENDEHNKFEGAADESKVDTVDE